MKLFASLLLCLFIPAAWAAGTAAPKLDIGKGGQCVEDVQWMRKNHMNLLKHQRDETVHKGVTARADSFCVGCHRYEAVKVDCFECHSDKRKSAWLEKNAK